MKVVASIIMFFIFASFCNTQVLQKNENRNSKFHNEIDDIENDNDIDKLLASINKKQFEVFIVKKELEIKDTKCRELAESVQAKSWTKADFDNNGYTDILIIGDNYGLSSVVVLDKGKNNFIAKTLTKGFPDCTVPVVRNSESQPVIIYHTAVAAAKTLVYKFGDFIEISNSSPSYAIERIEYKTSICFGTCP